MALRALRGATQVEVDDRQAIIDATAELVRAVLEGTDSGTVQRHNHSCDMIPDSSHIADK